jgi:DtxR family Mn-dependent transcriptional regulator
MSIVPLSILKIGEKGRISKIECSEKIFKRLLDMGLIPNTPIEVIAKSSGTIEITVRGSKLAIGKEISEKIFIEKES